MKNEVCYYPNEDHPLIHTRQPRGTKTRSFTSLHSVFALMGIILVIYRNLSRYNETKSVPLLQQSSSGTTSESHNRYIYPGQIFHDTDGDAINAHGGGFLYYNNTYYWYGEIKRGETYLPEANVDWGGTRVDFVGISCYASNDLLNWRKCRTYNVLPANTDDPLHDLHPSKVAERPKVVYNGKTDTFVMWLHVDTMDYQLARCGVAMSSSPEGPFIYLRSFRPQGQMARDLTIFVDDDWKAYLFTSSEDNAVMHITELTDDYLNTIGMYQRVFIGDYVEAPTLFKRNGMYYFIGSGCTAWQPNAAKYALASSVWGPWNISGNPCVGQDSNTTFHSQSTYVIPVSNASSYIFAADRWNMNNLSDSRYVWLPISFGINNDTMEIIWQDYWRP
eukprot:scaffold1137_cov55-Cyclotella_meneghiniana.AAC.3